MPSQPPASPNPFSRTPFSRPASATAPTPARFGLNRTRLGPSAPGFHRFRIGINEAATVSDGPLTLSGPDRVFPGIPTDQAQSLLAAAGLDPERIRLEQNCLLLDLGGHLVLFDTGMGTSNRFGLEAGQLWKTLQANNIPLDAIDALVFTHAHPDHCWGTMKDDATPAFPNAQIYISEIEWQHWASRTEAQDTTSRGFRRHLYPLHDRVTLLRAGEEFLPGLHPIPTPGHSPGHFSYLISSADEEACFVGDVAFHEVLSYAFPDAECAYDEDRAVGAVTRRNMLGALAREDMPIIGYHQPWPGLGKVRAEGEGFRYLSTVR